MNTERIIRTLHRLCYRKKYKELQTELFGLPFQNPVGVSCACIRSGKQACRYSDLGLGFVVLDPSNQEIRLTVSQLNERNKETRLAVEIATDIVRSFSLFYDFADFFILSPDNLSGMQSPEIPDICEMLDELLGLRLYYENYKPILLRLSPGYTPDEIRSLLDYCQVSGIDGIAISGKARIRQVSDYTQGRLPILAFCEGNKPEEARELLISGASLIETGAGFHKAHKILQHLTKQPLNA